jgi:hypothetical protein
MDPLIVTQAINVLYGVSTLAVLALGLAVIFGCSACSISRMANSS